MAQPAPVPPGLDFEMWLGPAAATVFTIVSDIATRTDRKLTWDWTAERFINDEVANAMLRRPMRSPWVL